MDHAIYTAMGAANAALHRQAVTSHNLANATTDGFQAQLTAYRAVPVNGPGQATRILVTESTSGTDSRPGEFYSTGRALDVALPEHGWLGVEMEDGSRKFTRNGSLQIDHEGQLRVKGKRLLGEGGTVRVPGQSALTIAADGTITARHGAITTPVGRIDIFEARRGILVRDDDGFFSVNASDAPGLAPSKALRLVTGMLESSNVSPVQSMTAMIATARNFEMNMKLISTVDNNEKRANQLLSIG